MMRSKPSSSMQKTYDECYLLCSTAVYFEGQKNEAEALRSWKSALEAIYYHNAYRVSANYVPKTETEKALQDSLRELELQCKERVDLLEALQESRKEVQETDGDNSSKRSRSEKGKQPANDPSPPTPGWIGDGTIPPVGYMDLSKPVTLPVRPAIISRTSDHPLLERSRSTGESPARATSIQTSSNSATGLIASAATPLRASSPEKRRVMLTTLRQTDPKKAAKRKLSANRNIRPAASRAAGLAWNTPKPVASAEGSPGPADASATFSRKSISSDSEIRRESDVRVSSSDEGAKRTGHNSNPSDILPTWTWRDPQTIGSSSQPCLNQNLPLLPAQFNPMSHSSIEPTRAGANTATTGNEPKKSDGLNSTAKPAPKPAQPPRYPVYHKEYQNRPSVGEKILQIDPTNKPPPPSQSDNVRNSGKLTDFSTPRIADHTGRGSPLPSRIDSSIKPATIPRRTAASSRTLAPPPPPAPRRRKMRNGSQKPKATPSSSDQDSLDDASSGSGDDHSARNIMRHLPKGVDVTVARQILNEIVVRGDEVHWDDVAGLEMAKKALKEAVVYPFLRPDLFMGLREPARGMLLFGPPGTGKTMLARAVATESKSTFFSISASSLTSKWHGESEKLVRALFGLAKALAPSIIFVDEIDSLLSTRSSGTEHEASRRAKTEFLIQWSDLQRAAAGREQTEGDASRVLVLAATNVPWDIDEAARRRFVRRQYIPLPEGHVREEQFRRLLSHQKHSLLDVDIKVLVGVTEGFSGSDITALAKDAAMGPLRNLGEALLDTPMDQIPPIQFQDFEASLYTIRPSVGKEGLKRYEAWAEEYGERGG